MKLLLLLTWPLKRKHGYFPFILVTIVILISISLYINTLQTNQTHNNYNRVNKEHITVSSLFHIKCSVEFCSSFHLCYFKILCSVIQFALFAICLNYCVCRSNSVVPEIWVCCQSLVTKSYRTCYWMCLV